MDRSADPLTFYPRQPGQHYTLRLAAADEDHLSSTFISNSLPIDLPNWDNRHNQLRYSRIYISTSHAVGRISAIRVIGGQIFLLKSLAHSLRVINIPGP